MKIVSQWNFLVLVKMLRKKKISILNEDKKFPGRLRGKGMQSKIWTKDRGKELPSLPAHH